MGKISTCTTGREKQEGCNVEKCGHISKANHIPQRICFITFITLAISVFFCKAELKADKETL